MTYIKIENFKENDIDDKQCAGAWIDSKAIYVKYWVLATIWTRHISGNRLWALHSKCDIWKKCLHLIAFMSVDVFKGLILNQRQNKNRNISKKREMHV